MEHKGTPMQSHSDRLTHEQMKRVLVHATGDRYECPLCGHLNLVLYGDNLADCKNGCDNTAVYRKLREKLGLHRAAKQKSEAAAPTGPGLAVEQYAAAKKLDADWLRQTWNLTDTVYCGVPAVEFPYTWLALDGKQLVSGPATTIKYRWGMNGAERRNKKGLGVDLYGQAQLHLFQAEQDKPFDCCFIVEGESDTQTLIWNGFPALGVPGVGIWREAWAQNPFLAF